MTSEQDMLTIALVGTRHSGGAPLVTEPPVDQLPLAAREPERALLLRAGAWDAYRRAGYAPAAAPEPPTAAPVEARAVCSPGATDLLAALLAERQSYLLPEALERLDAAGLRLSPALLPLALTQAHFNASLRPALAPALGERGRWLAQFNPLWAWAAGTLDEAADIDEAGAQRLWEEGALAQRTHVLRRLRQRDPARARDLLADVWKREKVEARVALLEPLAVNLSAADEPLLTAALADRVDRVRAAAANLLVWLPDSALAQRMRRRAEATLIYADGALDAEPPTAADADWTRDLPADALDGRSLRQTLLMQPIGRVPPEHWETYFGATPDTLIAATAASPWRGDILEAWTQAASFFGSARWATPLWRFWLSMWQGAQADEKGAVTSNAPDLCITLAPLVPAAELDAFALRQIAEPTVYPGYALGNGLELARRPWSPALASAYLSGLRAFAESLSDTSTSTDPWGATLQTAALALPASHFAQALEPFTLPDNLRWQVAVFKRDLNAFDATIHMRARIMKEIPL